MQYFKRNVLWQNEFGNVWINVVLRFIYTKTYYVRGEYTIELVCRLRQQCPEYYIKNSTKKYWVKYSIINKNSCAQNKILIRSSTMNLPEYFKKFKFIFPKLRHLLSPTPLHTILPCDLIRFFLLFPISTRDASQLPSTTACFHPYFSIILAHSIALSSMLYIDNYNGSFLS